MKRFFAIFLLLVTLIISSCDFVSQKNPVIPVIEGPVYRTWDEFLASLASDDIGKYQVIASSRVEDDSGFSVEVSERFYVELEKTRFVVEQKGLRMASQSHSGTIKNMRFLLAQSGAELMTQNISLTNLPEPAFSGAVLVTDLLQAKSADDVLTAHRCAVLDITYTDEAFYPMKLDTCRRGVFH